MHPAVTCRMLQEAGHRCLIIIPEYTLCPTLCHAAGRLYRFLQATAHAGHHHSRRATASSIYSSGPHNRKSAPIASCCSAPRPPGEGPAGEPGQCRTTPGEEGPPEAPQGLRAHGGRDGRHYFGNLFRHQASRASIALGSTVERRVGRAYSLFASLATHGGLYARPHPCWRTHRCPQ